MAVTPPPDPAGPTSAVERRIVSVVFADLVGFTPLTERLDLEDVASIQDAYFAAVRETIERYGGAVEKFIGDAVMAVFGLPRARDDDADRAVRAGLAMIGAVEQLNAGLGLEEGELRLRVGATTGEVVHSTTADGSGTDEGRVSGDPVNTAARLQSAAEPGMVLVDDTTALAVADSIELDRSVDLELKGKTGTVRGHPVRAVRPKRARELAMGSLRAPLLGREDDLALLLAAGERARRGAREHWLLVAPPGVGKTRLLEEVAARLLAGDAFVAWRIRLRPEIVGPYEPIREIALAAVSAAGGTDRQALTTAMVAQGHAPARAEVLADRFWTLVEPADGAGSGGGASGGGGSGSEDRDELFAGWLEALGALAGDHPQAWLVEDVHWAGPDLLAFLSAAHAAPATHGRLILATARPSLLEAAPDWASPDPGQDRNVHHLPTLEPAAAADLVRGLVGDALPNGLVERIAERSDGNPLFIEELLRTWVSVGTLVPATDGWQLTIDAREAPLPRTVQQIYAAQLDDLPPAARMTARRASVAGRRFPFSVLERLGIRDGAEAVDQLTRRALVAGPRSDPLEGDTFAYRHALLRDAGYASLARAERARLHVELARWLEGVAGQRRAEVAETIGTHYASALESAPALAREVAPGLTRELCAAFAAEWLEQAAVAALEVAAHAAAATLARRSLELTAPGDVLGSARRTEILADAIAASSDLGEALAVYERALGLFRTARAVVDEAADVLSARNGVARTAATAGQLLTDRLHFGEARDLADRVLRELGEAEDEATARLLVLRGWAASSYGERGPQPEADVERGLRIALAIGHRELELEARSSLAGVHSEHGTGAIEDWTALRQSAQRFGDWRRALDATINEAMWLVDLDVDRVWPLIEAAAATAEARGLPETLAWTDYLGAEAGFVAGDWDRAVASGFRAIEVGERNGYHRVCVRTWFDLVPIAAARGRRDLLEHAARWFADHAADFPGSPYGLMMHGAVDVRLAAAGVSPPFVPDPESLEASFREDFSSPSWLDAVATILESWVRAGLSDAARAAAEVIERSASPASRSSRLGPAGQDLAIAIATGDEGRALAAHRAFAGIGAPWFELRSLRAGGEGEGAEARALEARLGIASE